jgi:endonuclease/exonuclease/phosphatase (EEP) superfamily protein YafD
MLSMAAGHVVHDFPPQPPDGPCQSPSLFAFMLPDILMLSAYLYFFYLMRIAENEQMETLMERAFLQTSCPASLSNQRHMLRSLRIWLAAGILWLLASSGAQLLYLATADIRFSVISRE